MNRKKIFKTNYYIILKKLWASRMLLKKNSENKKKPLNIKNDNINEKKVPRQVKQKLIGPAGHSKDCGFYP